MPKKDDKDGSRSNDPTLLILTSLASGAKHGYALLQDIEAFAHVRLGPGTLYGAIARLERQGWIEPLETSGRARPYRMTAGGRHALEAMVSELRTVTDEARSRLALTLRPASLGGRA